MCDCTKMGRPRPVREVKGFSPRAARPVRDVRKTKPRAADIVGIIENG